MLSVEEIILSWVLFAFLIYILMFIFFIKLNQPKKPIQNNHSKRVKMQINQKRLKNKPNTILTEVFRYGNIKITISNGRFYIENSKEKIFQTYSSITLPKKYKDILEEFEKVQEAKNLQNKSGNMSVYKDGNKTFYTSEI